MQAAAGSQGSKVLEASGASWDKAEILTACLGQPLRFTGTQPFRWPGSGSRPSQRHMLFPQFLHPFKDFFFNVLLTFET